MTSRKSRIATKMEHVEQLKRLKQIPPIQIHQDLADTLEGSSVSCDIVKTWCREFNYGRESWENDHGHRGNLLGDYEANS